MIIGTILPYSCLTDRGHAVRDQRGEYTVQESLYELDEPFELNADELDDVAGGGGDHSCGCGCGGGGLAIGVGIAVAVGVGVGIEL
jgi:hypothetical protein